MTTEQTATWRNAYQAARFISATTHVATSYFEVAVGAADRAESNYPGNRRVKAATVTAFLICHRRNRREYQGVMSGRIA